jgi:hypothetical protein
MFYGQHVATSFGLLKPTKVLMYYKVAKNTFSMMVLNDVESQQSATGPEIIDLDSSDNEVDNQPEIQVILSYTAYKFSLILGPWLHMTLVCTKPSFLINSTSLIYIFHYADR